MPVRLSVGEIVEIRDVIATSHIGSAGVITSIRSSRYSSTLDKYLVRFPNGLEKTFWDIQLQRPIRDVAQDASFQSTKQPHPYI
jgi:hypothetical protein